MAGGTGRGRAAGSLGAIMLRSKAARYAVSAEAETVDGDFLPTPTGTAACADGKLFLRGQAGNQSPHDQVGRDDDNERDNDRLTRINEAQYDDLVREVENQRDNDHLA